MKDLRMIKEYVYRIINFFIGRIYRIYLYYISENYRLGRLHSKNKPKLFFGTSAIINNKYWSNALRENGYESQTVMSGFMSINKKNDFDLYFVNDKRVNNPSFREVGYKHLDFVRNIMQITPEEIPDPSDDRITIIYTGNFGDERYMASGWILAHRFGHAISRSDNSTVGDLWRKFIKNLADIFKDILSKVYNIEVDLNMRGNYSQINKNQKILKFAAQQIGTMKSARENNLRNWYEFAYELLAQYLISGKIKFNPLPKSIIIGFGPYGRKEMRYTKSEESRQDINSSELDYYASTIEYQLEEILGACLNKIFVM